MKKRGKIWWVNFDPAIGQEVRKSRPAIVVSNDKSNKALQRYQVVPLTSRMKKVYPGETIISLNGKAVRVLGNQIMTVSALRFTNKIGKVTDAEMKRIEQVLIIQLGLDGAK